MRTGLRCDCLESSLQEGVTIHHLSLIASSMYLEALTSGKGLSTHSMNLTCPAWMRSQLMTVLRSMRRSWSVNTSGERCRPLGMRLISQAMSPTTHQLFTKITCTSLAVTTQGTSRWWIRVTSPKILYARRCTISTSRQWVGLCYAPGERWSILEMSILLFMMKSRPKWLCLEDSFRELE